MSHEDLIRDQFTRQAVPFSETPAIRDEEALRLLVEIVGAGPQDTVLDVACGPGLVVSAFAGVARHATGIDLTPAMIERARALAHQEGLSNVTFDVGDVEALPSPDTSFSIVTSRFAFHHFLDPGAVLHEMTRVCVPGGKVVVVDAAVSPDPKKAEAFNRMEQLRDPSHVRALTLAELIALFAQAGLPEPRTASYNLKSDLDGLLSRSFPEPGDAERIRQMFVDALSDDGLGMGTRRRAEQILFAYPVALLMAAR